MLIFDDITSRGIYRVDDYLVFDGYFLMSYFKLINEYRYGPIEIIQHIKRAVPKKKQDKEFLKQSK